jgi:hypothetical protein
MAVQKEKKLKYLTEEETAIYAEAVSIVTRALEANGWTVKTQRIARMAIDFAAEKEPEVRWRTLAYPAGADGRTPGLPFCLLSWTDGSAQTDLRCGRRMGA